MHDTIATLMTYDCSTIQLERILTDVSAIAPAIFSQGNMPSVGLSVARTPANHSTAAGMAANGKELWARTARTVDVALRPFVAGCEEKDEVAVSYHDVPVPRAAEACNLCQQLAGLGQYTGRADVTAAVDMAMRFACLAYRRNSGRLAPSSLVLAPSAESGGCLAVLPDGSCIASAEAVECQFSTPSGAHAVVYLLREPAPAARAGERPSTAGCASESSARAAPHGAGSHVDCSVRSSEVEEKRREWSTGQGERRRKVEPEGCRPKERSRLVAVLAFKGSTLVSPGSAPLSDWRANLSILLPSFARAASTAVGPPAAAATAAQAAEGLLPQPQGLPIALERRDTPGLRGETRAGGGSARGSGGGGGGAGAGGAGDEGVFGPWGAAPAAADAGAHPGFVAYYGELVASFRRLQCGAIGEALCGAWGLPAEQTMWQLLHSTHVETVLCVGHSLGGALAALAATHIGASVEQLGCQTGCGGTPQPHHPDHGTIPPPGAALSPPGVPLPAAPPPWATHTQGWVDARSAAGSCASTAQAAATSADSLFTGASPLAFSAADPTPTTTAGAADAASPTAPPRRDASRPRSPPPAGTASASSADLTSPPRLPCLVTFGCPIVGGAGFVLEQSRCVIPQGGLRVFNMHDPVVSVGHGLLSFTTAAGGDGGCHAGHPLPLRNDALTTANPYTNHLRYVLDSFELFPTNPCARVRYALPGIVYTPDADGRAIAQLPRHYAPGAPTLPSSFHAFVSAARTVPGQTRPAIVAAPANEPAGSVCTDQPAGSAASAREVASAGSVFTDSTRLTAEAERLSAEAVASLAWTAQRARSLLSWGDVLGVQVTDGALQDERGMLPAEGLTPPAEGQAPVGAVALRGDAGAPGPDTDTAATAGESVPAAAEAMAEFEMVPAAVTEEGTAPADSQLWRGAPVALRQRWAEFWAGAAPAAIAADASGTGCGVVRNNCAACSTLSQVGGADIAGVLQPATTCCVREADKFGLQAGSYQA